MDRDSSFRRYRRFFGANPRRDVDEELAFHLAMRAEEFRRAGMSETEAEEATMQRFGNMREIRDEVETLAVGRHQRRRRAWRLDAVRQDVRFAWRSLVGNLGYSIVVALTLALGIGANAAVFSVAYGVILRPLPYENANELVRVWSSNVKRNVLQFSVSPADYLDWKTQSRAFTAMAAFERQREGTLLAGDRPQSVSITAVTPDIFSLLGTAPVMGRTLVADDARLDAPAVTVLSHELWTTDFGSDPKIVGRDVVVDGKRYAVVGVMPPRFFVPGTTAAMWTPLSFVKASTVRSERYLRVLGRLAPGVTREAADAQLDAVAERIATADPANAGGWSTYSLSVPEMIIGTQFRRAVLTLTGVVAFVLLIACANAANLQLARSAVRDREMAVRSALGASRGRLAQQLLVECALIALVAGALGLAIAHGGIAILRSIGETTIPRLEDVRLDAPVLTFTAIVALGSGVLFGLLPALRSSRSDVGEVLKRGGRGGQSLIGSGVRSALVVAEIGLSLVLLIGAGLLMRSFAHLSAVDIGFEEKNVVIARTTLPPSTHPTPDGVKSYYAEAMTRVASIPGVESVAATSSAPFAGVNSGMAFLRVGDPVPTTPAPDADYRVVTPGYFATMKTAMLRGRDFTTADREGAPDVVIINAAFAKQYWPNDDPIGQQIRVGDIIKGPVLTVVGVVGDVRYYALENHNVRPMMFFSWHAASAQRTTAIVVRVRQESVLASVNRVLGSIDSRLPPPNVTTFSEIVADVMATPRFALTLFGLFAGLAVVLAAIGLFGVLAYLVRQRTHELGIRVALGATQGRLMRSVIGGAVRMTAIGVAIGLFASYALTKSLGTLLFDVSPTDATTFIVLPLVLSAVAILASVIPALRATRADPMVALRGDA